MMATVGLTGTIRDAATGLPLPDVEVRAAVVEPAGCERVATRTDARGAFSLTLAWPGDGEARVELDARGAGHAAERWPRYDLAPEGVRVAHGGAVVADLALGPGFSLALEVVDEGGLPVEGAVVDVIENNTVARCCSWPLARRWLPDDEQQPRTDGRGRLAIPGLRSALAYGERYFVSIRHPDRAEGLLDRPEHLARDGTIARARLVLPAGHVVEGSLRGAGRVGEGKVVAVLDDPTVPGCHGVTRTAKVAADGRFRVSGLRDGAHLLRVSTPGASPREVAVRAPATGPIDIDLFAGRAVRGSVLDDGGEPVEGASVSVESADGDYRVASTDARGSFSFEGLPAGARLDLVASVGGSASTLVEPLGYAVLDPSTEDAAPVIDARRRVLWTGRLHDDRTGAPLANQVLVMAQVRGATIVLRAVGAERDGRFAVRLPPGVYTVGLEAMGELDAVAAALVRDVVIEEGAPGDEIRVDAVAAFRVPVTVIDAATGAPLAGAAVTGRPLELWGRFYLGNTGADGVFFLEPAAEAPLRVSAEAEGYARSQTVEVTLQRGMDPIVIGLDRLAARPH